MVRWTWCMEEAKSSKEAQEKDRLPVGELGKRVGGCGGWGLGFWGLGIWGDCEKRIQRKEKERRKVELGVESANIFSSESIIHYLSFVVCLVPHRLCAIDSDQARQGPNLVMAPHAAVCARRFRC